MRQRSVDEGGKKLPLPLCYGSLRVLVTCCCAEKSFFLHKSVPSFNSFSNKPEHYQATFFQPLLS